MPDARSHFYFDTVSLSNFALSGRLDLLITRYGKRLQITPAVLDEISDGITAGYAALNEIESALANKTFSYARPLTTSERTTYRALLRILSSGEAACIACAQIRGGIVVTDDKVARECCTERKIKFTGTVGILKACCTDETLSPQEADRVLQAMIQAGYYSPVRNISGLL